MAGVFDFLHIKRNTAGSSNELSFDVWSRKEKRRSRRGPRRSESRDWPSIVFERSERLQSVEGFLCGRCEHHRRYRARPRSKSARRRAMSIRLRVQAAADRGGGGGGRGSVFALRDSQGTGRPNGAHRQAGRSRNRQMTTISGNRCADGGSARRGKRGDRVKALSAIPKMITELNRVSVDVQTLGLAPLDNDSKVMVDQLAKTAQARNGMLGCAAEAFRASAGPRPGQKREPGVERRA